MRPVLLPRRAVLAATALSALPLATAPAVAADLPPDREIADAVRAEFLHAWQGYKDAAWGYDEARPVSGKHNDFFADGHSFGLSMVEALDTLWLMEQDDEVGKVADWLEANFDPAADVSIQLFETVIRLVGGLLAGYLCTGREKLLSLCRELTDRLLPAFHSPTGMPYRYVNLRTGAVSGKTSPLAEIATNLPEFGLLSRLTGDQKYVNAAKAAARAVVTRRSALGLLGTELDVESGKWTNTESAMPNPPVDSCYEYLWVGGELLGDDELRGWYRQLTDALIKYQLVRPNNWAYFRQVDAQSGQETGRESSELAAFYAGLLGKGGDLALGREYFKSWTATIRTYPVLPERYDFQSGRILDGGSALRPEYPNSAFDLWRLTGDAEYKQAAYQYFQNLRANQRVSGGYTVATDVTSSPVRLGDLTPGYFFAENLKYVYLIFAAAPRFDYQSGLLSTEGKLLRGAVRPNRVSAR